MSEPDWIEQVFRWHWATERDKTGLEKAQAKFDQKDYEGASRELTHLVEHHEPYTDTWLLQDAHVLLAQCHALLGRFDLVMPVLCAGLDYSRDKSGAINVNASPIYFSKVELFLGDHPELQPRTVTPKISELYGSMYLANTKSLVDEQILRKVPELQRLPSEEQEALYLSVREWTSAREHMFNAQLAVAATALEDITPRKLICPFPSYIRTDLFICYVGLGAFPKALTTIDDAIAMYPSDRLPLFEPVFRQEFLQEHPELDTKHL